MPPFPDPMEGLQGSLGAALQGMPPEAPQPPMGGNPMEGALMGESPQQAPPQMPQLQKMSGGMKALSMLGAGLTGWADAKLGTNRSGDYLKMLSGLKTDRQQAHLTDLISFRQKIFNGDEQGAMNVLGEKRLALGDEGTSNGDSARQVMSFQDDPAGTLQEVDDIIIPLAARLGVKLPKELTERIKWKARDKPFEQDGKMVQLFTNDKGEVQLRPIGGMTPGKGSEVKSSTILDDGTSIMLMKNGKRLVRNAEGTKIKGKEAADAIRNAQAQGALWQGERSGARRRATLTADQSNNAFKSIISTRKNIRNYDRAIAELDKGASTGKITRMFPSFKESTIRLEQAGRELGLDVIGSVTFGALSEGELNLAMDTAMPTNLDSPALRRWLVDRRDAQTKLAKYYEEAAVYLGTPGNTMASWIASGQMKQLETGESDDAAFLSEFGLE